MALDNKILERAIARQRQDLEERRQRFQSRAARIYAGIPRVAEIDRELRGTMGQIVSSAFRRGADPTSAIQALKERNLSLQRERAQLLAAHGYSARGPCRCLMAYYTREQNRELSKLLDLGNQSFDTFDFSWYSTDYWPEEKSSPRENMEIVYELCANYAHSFSPRSTNLLMTGAPGLGKTFLSACIAREVSDAGFSVVYDTAAHIFSQFESGKFGRENPYDEDANADIHRYLHCDLLIADDLGSEMATALVTSALYQIVNTRLITGKQTILNTNLPLSELGRRYGAATLSRIEGDYQILTFFGEDIRKLKLR